MKKIILFLTLFFAVTLHAQDRNADLFQALDRANRFEWGGSADKSATGASYLRCSSVELERAGVLQEVSVHHCDFQDFQGYALRIKNRIAEELVHALLAVGLPARQSREFVLSDVYVYTKIQVKKISCQYHDQNTYSCKALVSGTTGEKEMELPLSL